MAITFGNSSSAGGSTPSFNNNGDFLVILISSVASGVSAVTYNGVAMTQIGTETNISSRYQTFWGLVNPAQGTNSFAITGGSSEDNRIQSISGVNQTTPYTNVTLNTGNSAAASLTLTTTANSYIFGVVNSNNDETAGTDTTEVYGDFIAFMRSTNLVDTASGTINATQTSTPWAFKGFSLNPPVITHNLTLLGVGT